jgi:hypothetical protein
MAIQFSPDEILTPPLAGLGRPSERLPEDMYLFVTEAMGLEFAGGCAPPGMQGGGPGAVILRNLGLGWDFWIFSRAVRSLQAGRPRYLMALDVVRYRRAVDGLHPDRAPYCIALQHAASVEPVVLDKPAADFFAAALRAVGADADQLLVIGGDMRSDVGGAPKVGVHGVLVGTVEFRPADVEEDVRPDAALAAIADLPRRWDAQGGSP